MNQFVTKAIVLTRTNYGEADRIITVITPNNGKVRLIAKGVRKPKSKLAGGIELFSISDITFRRGKGEIGTLVSARLDRHFANIVKDIDRTMLGYDLIKMVNKATEDVPDKVYYDLLSMSLNALNDSKVSILLIKSWFEAQLLLLDGYSPDLYIDTDGRKLDPVSKYEFDFESTKFKQSVHGQFDATKIKFLRLLFSNNSPKVLQKIGGLDELIEESSQLVRSIYKEYIRQ